MLYNDLNNDDIAEYNRWLAQTQAEKRQELRNAKALQTLERTIFEPLPPGINYTVNDDYTARDMIENMRDKMKQVSKDVYNRKKHPRKYQKLYDLWAGLDETEWDGLATPPQEYNADLVTAEAQTPTDEQYSQPAATQDFIGDKRREDEQDAKIQQLFSDLMQDDFNWDMDIQVGEQGYIHQAITHLISQNDDEALLALANIGIPKTKPINKYRWKKYLRVFHKAELNLKGPHAYKRCMGNNDLLLTYERPKSTTKANGEPVLPTLAGPEDLAMTTQEINELIQEVGDTHHALREWLLAFRGRAPTDWIERRIATADQKYMFLINLLNEHKHWATLLEDVNFWVN